jgi:uncharacterized membrane protein
MHNAPLQTNHSFATAAGTPAPAPGPSPLQPSPEMLAMQAQRARKQGIAAIVIGVALLVIGVAVTVATYASASASSTGGTYIVAWGPIVFGPIAAIRGFVTLARAQAEADRAPRGVSAGSRRGATT